MLMLCIQTHQMINFNIRKMNN